MKRLSRILLCLDKDKEYKVYANHYNEKKIFNILDKKFIIINLEIRELGLSNDIYFVTLLEVKG